MGSVYGLTALTAIMAMGAAFAAERSATAGRAASLAALLAVGLALSLSGHAGSARPQWLTRPAVFVHGIAVAYWLGALAPLASILRGGGGRLHEIVRRWSTGAVAAVAALAATGAALAVVQVQDPALLLGTAYGWILCGKLALVALLVGFATVNRLKLTPALEANPTPAARRLATSASFELALSVLILALVAAWRFTPPPRAFPAPPAPTAPAVVHLHGPRLMAEVTLDPARVGPVRARVRLADRGGDLDPKEVVVRFANPTAGVEAIQEPAARSEDGSWTAHGAVLPVPGRWTIEVEILVSDFERAVLEGEFQVRQ
jgi:copper transport protein